MKGYLVDAGKREIREIEYTYTTIREHLPGGICIAQVFPNGDVLYVDDEGLLKPAVVAFRLHCRRDGQPMMSNAILTGPDDLDDTLPPGMTPAELQASIQWLTVEEALAWFRAKADDPAVTITAGKRRDVIASWAQMLANLEGRPGGYRP